MVRPFQVESRRPLGNEQGRYKRRTDAFGSVGASLSLSMLLSSLGTSIANVGLPTVAQVFSRGLGPVRCANARAVAIGMRITFTVAAAQRSPWRGEAARSRRGDEPAGGRIRSLVAIPPSGPRKKSARTGR